MHIGNDEENWCLTRSQDVPSSLSEFDQPINQTFDQPINQTFDQPINQTFDVNQNGTEPEPNMTATCTGMTHATYLLCGHKLALVVSQKYSYSIWLSLLATK